MSYRTYALNDFSVVSKAFIYTLNNDLSKKDKLPVQFNPSTFSFAVKSKTNILPMTENRIKLKRGGTDKEDNCRKINFTLMYDIFDEYNLRTLNDTIGLNGISLLEEDVTSLPKLVKHAGGYVVFSWGGEDWGSDRDEDIGGFLGIMAAANVDFACFSRWGKPLKASVAIDIVEDTGTKLSPTTVMDIKSENMLENVSTYAGVAAMNALRAF
ncbi:MAG: hypothetical protein RsTaC01_0651 [Candidatus Paraimprobicoccus trichonymphae]|uniref:Contractile injection system tube protein N-terminal domain-containing protein n=1 Tax=Candidatus Paraimprobicoccus trichonymphae TaxID=3033793 RepID=A0AA48KXU4_9FIRM|nr:MAG: hypothetical protein RsTaC01_0651 [Candidatus Paraimprobicoccus trichonymphae]